MYTFMILKRVISFHQIANERGERHNTLFPSKHNDFHTCGFKNGFKKKKKLASNSSFTFTALHPWQITVSFRFLLRSWKGVIFHFHYLNGTNILKFLL